MKTETLSQTHALAADFVEKLRPKAGAEGGFAGSAAATIIGLYGDLGSGKTSFVQGMAKALGVDTAVASPTFVLQKIYKLGGAAGFSHLIHIDAYRMDSPAELAHIGWDEIIKDSGNLICIEWPERVATDMPEKHIRVKCAFIDENTREFDVEM